MGRRSDPGDELVPLPTRSAGAAPVASPVAPADDGDRRSGFLPVVGAGLLLVALVAGGALTGADGGRRHTATEQAAARPPAPAPLSADEPAPAGWRRGSPGP